MRNSTGSSEPRRFNRACNGIYLSHLSLKPQPHLTSRRFIMLHNHPVQCPPTLLESTYIPIHVSSPSSPIIHLTSNFGVRTILTPSPSLPPNRTWIHSLSSPMIMINSPRATLPPLQCSQSATSAHPFYCPRTPLLASLGLRINDGRSRPRYICRCMFHHVSTIPGSYTSLQYLSRVCTHILMD